MKNQLLLRYFYGKLREGKESTEGLDMLLLANQLNSSKNLGSDGLDFIQNEVSITKQPKSFGRASSPRPAYSFGRVNARRSDLPYNDQSVDALTAKSFAAMDAQGDVVK